MLAADSEINIRPLRDDPGDFACLARWLSDPRVLEFYEGRDHPFSLQAVNEKYSPRVLQADGVQACLILYEKRPLGYLQYESCSPQDLLQYSRETGLTAFSMDLFIGEPHLWGRGLGRRVVTLAAGWLFKHRHADYVTLDPHVDNERAIRCYQACGFQRALRLPEHENHEGRLVDCWLMIKKA